MGEVRAAFAIARKDVQTFSRYRISVASMVFTPLYQFIVPAFLFGAAFAVNGRAAGLSATLGTDDLPGFIFLGGVVAGLISIAFWGIAFALRTEADAGTLEPSWLTPTHHETFVIGRAMGGLFWFALSQIALWVIGIVFLGLRIRIEMLFALPAVLFAILSMVGMAYLLAAIVLLIREANFFVDTMQFAVGTMSGFAFPVTLLPGILQPIAFALPTTYAIDLLRVQALGSRPLFDPALEYVVLIALTAVFYPLGRWAFARAETTMRRRGMLSQY
ncbi:MAG: ABC transporter permease [Chloroflexi bacterium]|nr:MAG: ABC transporter permease [Chloroflexota bacterium]